MLTLCQTAHRGLRAEGDGGRDEVTFAATRTDFFTNTTATADW